MAVVTSTVTIDTGEWVYIDVTGIGHTVNNGQTFSLTVNDVSATVVEYSIPTAQSVTTTDGYTINFRPRKGMASGTTGNEAFYKGNFTDAGGGTDQYSRRGEICIECPVTKIVQHWKPLKMNPSDSDFGAAGTITMTVEDEFGHLMVMPAPSVGGSITVGQAA